MERPTILAVERFTRPGYTSLVLEALSAPERRGTSISVLLPNGEREVFSRFDTEERWHMDTRFAAGSCWPIFHNGQGARCTIPVLASPEMADLLDEASQVVAVFH